MVSKGVRAGRVGGLDDPPPRSVGRATKEQPRASWRGASGSVLEAAVERSLGLLQEAGGALDVALATLEERRGPAFEGAEQLARATTLVGIARNVLSAHLPAVPLEEEIEHSPVDLVELVQEIIVHDPFVPEADAIDLQVTGPTPVLGDRRLLGEALASLLREIADNRARPVPVLMDVHWHGDSASVFVGIPGTDLSLEGLTAALAGDPAHPGVARARAILEAHGGALTLARGRGHAFGLQARLPALGRQPLAGRA